MNPYLAAIICVTATAAGQLLFKLAAQLLNTSGTGIPWKALGIFGVALTLYALATVLWVWVLTRVDIGRVYPLMALSFVLVPVGNAVFYKTPLTPQVMIGAVVIVTGTLISVGTLTGAGK